MDLYTFQGLEYMEYDHVSAASIYCMAGAILL